jgi:hypothetical protein
MKNIISNMQILTRSPPWMKSHFEEIKAKECPNPKCKHLNQSDAEICEIDGTRLNF